MLIFGNIIPYCIMAEVRYIYAWQRQPFVLSLLILSKHEAQTMNGCPRPFVRRTAQGERGHNRSFYGFSAMMPYASLIP